MGGVKRKILTTEVNYYVHASSSVSLSVRPSVRPPTRPYSAHPSFHVCVHTYVHTSFSKPHSRLAIHVRQEWKLHTWKCCVDSHAVPCCQVSVNELLFCQIIHSVCNLEAHDGETLSYVHFLRAYQHEISHHNTKEGGKGELDQPSQPVKRRQRRNYIQQRERETTKITDVTFTYIHTYIRT